MAEDADNTNILYYRHSPEEVFRALNTSREGLNGNEVKSRLRMYGLNKLVEVKGESILIKCLRQFKDLMVVILLVAGVLSVYMKDYNSAFVLFLIVAINAFIGFFQEYKAERIMNALKVMIQPKARVLRYGKEIEINSVDLVPGDIVRLEEGAAVPADLRIFEENELSTNDFALTGESNPTRKFTHCIRGKVSIGDRNNIAFMGTTVATGNGFGVVIATGMQTEIGYIARLSQTTPVGLSPLQCELNNLAKRLTIITLFIAAFMLLIALGVHFSWREAFIFAVGIASCMVPQGLPAEVSVALSLAAGRLAAKNAVIKKLSAVETLGATHIICTDKTGTLTKNEMTVKKILIGEKEFEITGSGYEPKGDVVDKSGKPLDKESFRLFFATGIFASNARINPPDKEHPGWHAIGDPTEAALITLGAKRGLDPSIMEKEFPKLKEFPFDAIRKRMSSIRKCGQKTILYAKGAPHNLLERCTLIWDGSSVRKITDRDREFLTKKGNEWASEAFRNIAFAYREIDNFSKNTSMKEAENNMIFLGLAGMMDPPREEVKEAMEIAAKAFIRVIIITGDYALTAQAIAQKIGLGGGSDARKTTLITGEELQSISDIAFLQKLIHGNLIFARTSPEDKLRIVSLLKKAGEVVAVTGDGVNDAPALKKADIGVAMGKTGTEVAKNSSEIILLDDSFSTLVSAIKEGRTIFCNIAKTVRSNLTTNTGELTVVLLSLLASALFDIPLAILTLQILAIDLAGQLVPITFLTWDPPKTSLMTQPPRNPGEHIFNLKAFKVIFFSGVFMGLIGYANFLFLFLRNNTSLYGLSETNILYTRATTLTYLTLVIISFFNILSKRVDDNESVFSGYLWSNKRLLFGFVFSLGIVFLLIYNKSFSSFLHMGALTLFDWVYAFTGGFIYLAAYEFIKAVNRRKAS